MMNAPASHLAELETLLPGLESPSVIPLAHEGMIAIHAVVGADDVWGLLPRLKAAGASGILVLPIEKIGWSLGIAIALLVVLIEVNHFVPIKL